MSAYRDLYNKLEGEFDGCELTHIAHSSNEEADTLANIGSTCAPIPPGVFLERINQRSIKVPHSGAPPVPAPLEAPGEASTPPTTEQVEVLLINATWTAPYIAYLLRQELPDDEVEAKQLVRRAKAYTIINGELYKRSISGMFQRCIAPEEGQAILRDIHEGTCGHHAGSRALVNKAFRAGLYWLTAMQDAKALVERCEACQRFANKPHAPGMELQTIPLGWPFAEWGLDMVGPLKKSSPGGHTFMLVAVDKFTKWIEAMPVTSAATTCAVQFLRSIVSRFGVPHSIITDNGSNFTAEEFQDYCDSLGIQLKYASVAHP
jgi:hypothetical protein